MKTIYDFKHDADYILKNDSEASDVLLAQASRLYDYLKLTGLIHPSSRGLRKLVPAFILSIRTTGTIVLPTRSKVTLWQNDIPTTIIRLLDRMILEGMLSQNGNDRVEPKVPCTWSASVSEIAIPYDQGVAA